MPFVANDSDVLLRMHILDPTTFQCHPQQSNDGNTTPHPSEYSPPRLISRSRIHKKKKKDDTPKPWNGWDWNPMNRTTLLILLLSLLSFVEESSFVYGFQTSSIKTVAPQQSQSPHHLLPTLEQRTVWDTTTEGRNSKTKKKSRRTVLHTLPAPEDGSISTMNEISQMFLLFATAEEQPPPSSNTANLFTSLLTDNFVTTTGSILITAVIVATILEATRSNLQKKEIVKDVDETEESLSIKKNQIVALEQKTNVRKKKSSILCFVLVFLLIYILEM
jgi:hypothetical protein